MNLTAETERAARAKFDRLHPVHKIPVRPDTNYEVKLFPSPTTAHLRVQCGCGYMWRYPERELYGEGGTPKGEVKT